MPCAPVPKAAVAFLVSVVAIEIAFWHSSEPLTGLPYFQPTADVAPLVIKRQMAKKAEGSVVLVGDSACMMDLVPEVVERTLGQPVVNLGTIANFTMPGFVSLAEDALRCQPPPRAVVFVMLPHTINMTEQETRDFDLLGRYLWAYKGSSDVYDPSFADWRAWILAKHRFNLFPPEFGGSFENFRRQLESNRGWYPESKQFTGDAKTRKGFRPSTFSSDALRIFVLKAKARNIPVWFWWAPSPAVAYESDFRPAAHEELRAVASSAPWLGVLQDKPPVWPEAKFGSVTHLKPEAAREHSALFGRVLKENLKPSVDPPYERAENSIRAGTHSHPNTP
jgi:hypothetical protein